MKASNPKHPIVFRQHDELLWRKTSIQHSNIWQNAVNYSIKKKVYYKIQKASSIGAHDQEMAPKFYGSCISLRWRHDQRPWQHLKHRQLSPDIFREINTIRWVEYLFFWISRRHHYTKYLKQQNFILTKFEFFNN